MKVISNHWINTYCGTIGIVVAEYASGKRKVFTLPISGHNEEEIDIENLMVHGSEFRIEMLEQLLKELKNEKP